MISKKHKHLFWGYALLFLAPFLGWVASSFPRTTYDDPAGYAMGTGFILIGTTIVLSLLVSVYMLIYSIKFRNINNVPCTVLGIMPLLFFALFIIIMTLSTSN